MLKYAIGLILTFLSVEASSQTISYVMDSIMNEYMESGYANEHFLPIGKNDKYDLRTGKWEEYTVELDVTWYTKNSIPVSLSGYFLIYGEGKYEHDLREGTWKLYLLEDKTFKKIHYKTINYVKGKKEGERIDYFPNGKVAFRGVNQQDLMNGEQTLYYENGDKWDVGSYVNDLRTGVHSSYFMGGALKSTRYFNNDTLVGISTYYYSNGNVEWTVDHKNGVADGLYTYYYKSGQIWTQKVYKEGKVMDVKGTYLSDGTEVDHGTIKNGNGTIISYTLDGKVYNISTYENGIEISKEVIGEFE